MSILPCRDVDERGSGTVLMIATMLIAAMVAFVCACLLAWFGCIHQARAAADLTAIAGADALSGGSDACAAASVTASKNHATLTACHIDSNGFLFVVRTTVMVDAKPRVVFGPEHFSHTSEAGNL